MCWPPVAEELVLGAAQADALGAAGAGAARVLAVVGVGAHLHPAHVVGVPEHAVAPPSTSARASGSRRRGERRRPGRRRRRPSPGSRPPGTSPTEHLAGGAVDRDGVAARAAPRRAPGPRRRAGSTSSSSAPTTAHVPMPARHDRGVRGLAAAGGQHAVGDDHALQVVRVGLPADQDHVRAGRRALQRPARCRARSRPRPRPGTPAWRVVSSCRARAFASNCGNSSWLSLSPVHALIASSIVIRLSSTSSVAIRNAAAAVRLPDPRLQQPQLAALDGELDVAQVAVVGLQPAHRLAAARRTRLRVEQLELGERQRVADARDDVLALRVRQVVAVDAGLARGRVAREADPGARRLAEVAEHHAHHVDRGAQVVRDALAPAVEPGAVGVPRAEDRLDRQVELLARVLRELRGPSARPRCP